MSNHHYTQLLKEHTKQTKSDVDGGGSSGGRKRRKVKQVDAIIDLTDELPTTRSDDPVRSQDSDIESDEFEDVELDNLPKSSMMTTSETNDNQSTSDSEQERDFSFLDKVEPPKDDSITISLTRSDPVNPTKRKVQFIDKEARRLRIWIHQWYIVTMICHGVIRNNWCNEPNLISKLRSSISPDITTELESIRRHKGVSTANSVRFTSLIRTLMFEYSKKFKVSKQGIIRKNWNELSIHQINIERNVNLEKFKGLVTKFHGSRDIGAQGFVSLLRSLGLKVRLIFSLQPPDFTMITELPKIEIKNVDKPSINKQRNSKQRFLQTVKNNQAEDTGYKFTSSSYPIFWIEVWNKYNKKWLCVDPIVLKLVETPPMRRKSSFEPPMSDPTNNLIYVIAFEASGKIKDVTRRYANEFNARTVKKRLPSKSEEFGIWYNKVLQGANSIISNGKITSNTLSRLDILELKEFRDRDLCEGMPNNASGFKDHPIYALESQLRQNEIIYPMNETTKVGTFRFKSSGKSKKPSELVPVYKRTAVHYLRSAKAWYLRGRVLKVGEQPLRIKNIKKLKRNFDDYDDDEDNDVESTRLYAEFQTKLYIPPPIVDGKINKNSYGNIDIYVPTMIPEGGHLISVESVPIKLVEQAAKILNIDYARAIVAFDFGKHGGKMFKRVPNAREGGVLICKDHKPAIDLVLNELLEEEELQKRKRIEINALKNWKFFLTKLRIMKRLNKQHGDVDKPAKTLDSKPNDDESDKSSDYSVYSDEGDGDGDSEFEEGGFFVGDVPDNNDNDNDNETNETKNDFDHYDDDIKIGNNLDSINNTFAGDYSDTNSMSGGFFTKSGNMSDEGGFIHDTNFKNFDIEETKSIDSADENNVQGNDDDSNNIANQHPPDVITTYDTRQSVITDHALTADEPGRQNCVNTTTQTEQTIDDYIMSLPDNEFQINQYGEMAYNPTNPRDNSDPNVAVNPVASIEFASENLQKAQMPGTSDIDSDEFDFEYSDDD